MNEADSLVDADLKDEFLALRASKDGDLGDQVATTSGGAEAPNYPFVGDRVPLVLSNVVELPKMNGLEVLCRQRDDERTKTLPLLVLTHTHSPYAPSERGDGGSLRAPVVSNEFEEPGLQLGLRRMTKNDTSPEDRGSTC
jgi:CheY-like chemotaxis protein